MKYSIAWHKECLKNCMAYRERLKQNMKQISDDIEKLDKKINFYDSQIIAAELMGKDGFDSEKFRVAKKIKNDAKGE